MSLSIVIPAYNEEKRLPGTLDQIILFLGKKKYANSEIILVIDKSKDNTLKIAKEYSIKHKNVRVIFNPRKRGKGYAVRKGILESKGDLVLFTDADLSTPITELNNFIEKAKEFSIVIGSRAHRNSKIRKKLFSRVILGSAGNFLLRMLIIRKVKDTQCGFKLFRRDAAKRLFGMSRIDGFGFDFEIVFLAQKFKYRLCECPVEWTHKDDSKVTIQSHFMTFFELFRIIRNNLAGYYR